MAEQVRDDGQMAPCSRPTVPSPSGARRLWLVLVAGTLAATSGCGAAAPAEPAGGASIPSAAGESVPTGSPVELAREAAAAQRVTDLTTYRAAVAALVARCTRTPAAEELARYQVVATRWADTLDDDRPHAQAKYELLLRNTDLVGLARRC